MGFEYKLVMVEKKELDKIVCDRCSKEIKKESEGHWNEFGEPHTQYHEPHFDCFYTLSHSWGFASTKDGEHHEAVLCEPCYDEIFAGVKITVKRYF